METVFTGTKFDLSPWLIANTATAFVIFPFHDSELILQSQITGLFSHFLPNLHAIILVDSGFILQSPITRSLLNQYGERLKFIQQKNDDSSGVVLMEAIAYALDKGAKNVIQLANFSQDEINYLPEMLRHTKQYDLIIGSRFLEKQEFRCPQKQMQFTIDRWLNRTLLNRLLGGRLTDATSQVRCWSRVALELIVARLRLRNPHLLNLEMVYLSTRNDLRIMEFPIDYQPTVMVQSSILTTPPYPN